MPKVTGTSDLIETWAAGGTRVSASNDKIAAGWQPTERPPSQWFNFIIHAVESKINHIFRNGVSLWNSATNYPQGACVTHDLRPWFSRNPTQNSVPSLTNADWAAFASLLDVQNSVPIGGGLWTYATTAPTGWVFFQGQTISRAGNPLLFAVLGTRFGVGDGSTTFTLPDERGQFFRGWDNGRGFDSGRALGDDQNDEIRAHSHGNVPLFTPFGDSDRGTTTSAFSIDSIGVTGATGGGETRPRNISGRYMYRLG